MVIALLLCSNHKEENNIVPFCILKAKIIEIKHIEDVLSWINEETWFLVDLSNCMFEGAQALEHANRLNDDLQQRMQKGIIRTIYQNDY
jgi:hypothetical protein